MTKDRLAEFKEKAKEHEMESSKSKDKNKENMEATGSGMSKFQARVNSIEDKLKTLKTQVTEVKKMQDTLYCSPFVTESDLQKMENKSSQILSESIKIRKEIEMLSAETSPAVKEKSLINSNACQRIQMSQIDRVSNELRTIMNELRASQAAYIDKTKARFQRQKQIVAHGNEAFEGDIDINFDNHAVFTGGILMETQKAKSELQDLYEREKEIKDLETQIIEVNKLFKEVHVLVTEQGDMVDNIESNMSKTEANVETGMKELKKAEVHRTKLRKKYIIIVVIILIILLVIAIIIAISVSND